jgi:hypothetical protein
MRVATASAKSCRSSETKTNPKRVRAVKSAVIEPFVTAGWFWLYGQAGWRSKGPASGDALAMEPITQACAP